MMGVLDRANAHKSILAGPIPKGSNPVIGPFLLATHPIPAGWGCSEQTVTRSN